MNYNEYFKMCQDLVSKNTIGHTAKPSAILENMHNTMKDMAVPKCSKGYTRTDSKNALEVVKWNLEFLANIGEDYFHFQNAQFTAKTINKALNLINKI